MSLSVNPLDQLSPREREVLFLFLEGLAWKEIAGKLGIERVSVTHYKKRIWKKWKITSQGQFIQFCVEYGIKPPRKEAA